MNEQEAAAIVAAYVDAWNTGDEAERRRLLETSFADAGTYTDPAVDLAGRDALAEHAAAFGRRWPGARIELTSGIDHHHGLIRFGWRVAGPDGATLREGVDFAEIASDGRLRRIVGFFGPLPPPS